MQGKKILIIEDDGFIRQSIMETFLGAGAQVEIAADGDEGLRKFYQFQPDLVTLDLMMPHTNGWETCRQIRRLADTPIIMLTGLTDEETEVRALRMGAVDFVTKPFSARVLLERAKIAMHHAANPPENKAPALAFEDDYLSIDLNARMVTVLGQPVLLTKTEFDLLAYLVQHKQQLLTFDQILTHVWGEGYAGSTAYVHVYMSRLRQKIEEDPRSPRYLLSHRGIGYRFKA